VVVTLWQQANAAAWLHARYVTMCVISTIFALCISTKLIIDYYQVTRTSCEAGHIDSKSECFRLCSLEMYSLRLQFPE
jgi:hypothetical protein